MGRRLLRRYPALPRLLLRPELKPLRRLSYRLFPWAAHAIAGRYFSAGDLDAAREELADSRFSGRVLEKIGEVEEVIAAGVMVAPPPPAWVATSADMAPAPPSGSPPTVIHALHNCLPLDSAGYAHRSQALLLAQRSRGIRAYPYTRPGYPHDLGRGADRKVSHQTAFGSITYRHIAPTSDMRFRGTERDYMAHYAARLTRAARGHRAHLIHAHSNYLNGLAAVWAAKWAGCKSIYEVRGLWHETRASVEPAFRQSPLFAYQQTLELQAMRQADAVVTLSTPLKEWMLEHGVANEKIHVIGNAIDLKSFRLPPPDPHLIERYGLKDRIVIGYAGSLVAYEGLDVLVEAFARCQGRNGPDMALVIVGDGPERKRLMRLAGNLGVASHVHFTGRVPAGWVPAFLSLFDICPLPRHDLPVTRLVPPLKPLEIMAAEKPLLVSALPPLLAFGIDGESRLSFAPGDADALARQLRRLADDPALRKNIGLAGRHWVEKHGDWSENAEKYLRLYETLLGH